MLSFFLHFFLILHQTKADLKQAVMFSFLSFFRCSANYLLERKKIL